MRAAAAVAERELRVAFRSPVAYAVVGFYLLIHGIFFVLMLEEFSKRSFAVLAHGTPGPEHNLMDQVLQPLLTWDATLLLFLLPALTMRLFSEEWRSGTSDLLLTYPLREGEIVAGKLASAAVLLGLLVGLGSAHAWGAAAFGRIEPAMLASGHLGLWLCGVTMLSIGLLWSALTENQVIAFIATMVTLLVFTFAGSWAGPQSGAVGAALRWLSPLAHINPFTFGVPSVSDTFYFASSTAFFAYLTTGVLQRRRWRAAEER